MISNPEPRRVAEGLSRLLTAMAARREHARLLALPLAGALTLDRDGRCAGASCRADKGALQLAQAGTNVPDLMPSEEPLRDIRQLRGVVQATTCCRGPDSGSERHCACW